MLDSVYKYNIRYYAIGHSYLLHGPFVGWQTTGSWGMAASAPEHDYFHRVQARLQDSIACSMEAIAENYATYERLCTESATEETYRNSPEYKTIIHRLRQFRPNLITVYIGGGNTIAKDPESLGLFYRVLYAAIKENMPADAVVVCPFSNRRVAQFMQLAESYGFLTVDLTVMHQKGKSPENPYYAIGQYPEYEDAVNHGAIEFRTHPGDFGHDAIAEGIVNVALEAIKQRQTPHQVRIPECVLLQAPECISQPTRLQLQIHPLNADSDVRWWTDNENIAVVDRNGVVTPINNGDVCVHVQCQINRDLCAAEKLKIQNQPDWYTLRHLPGTDEPVYRLPEDKLYLRGEYSLKPQGAGYLPMRKGYLFTGWTDVTEGDDSGITDWLIMDRDRVVRANWAVADHWDFDSVYDSAGVHLGGFNVRYENSVARVSSAPGTGAAVYHSLLHLPTEKYQKFRVRMQVDYDHPNNKVLLWVKTTEGEYSCTHHLPSQRMEELELSLTGAAGIITQFRIEPQMTDCCIYIDWIRFE